MKRLKKFVALFALAAVCFALPGVGSTTVKAAEPTTYVVNYKDGEWRFKQASTWSDSSQDRELYYLQQQIKDGDYVVVENLDGNGNSQPLKLSVRLGNLTIKSSNSETDVVHANGYDSVYVLPDTVAAINGDVAHAYVYGNAKANFNSNVTTLEMIGIGGDSLNNLHAYINCAGTVNHLIAKDDRDQSTYFDYYNFAAGKLAIEDGSVRTDTAYYSKTAPAAVVTNQPEQPTQTAAPAQATQPTSNAAASSSAYDNVPKTGDSSVLFWLLSAAAVCLFGGFALRRKEYHN